MGDRLLAVEQLLGDRLAIDREQKCLAHAPIGQQLVVEIGVDVFPDQRRLVDDVVLGPVTLLEGDGLVEREAEFAQHIVDTARQEIGFERCRVLDDLDDDALEARLLARPCRVLFEGNAAARHALDDAVGTEREGGIGRVGIVGRLVAIFGRVGVEDRLLDMGRQQQEADAVVVEGDAVDRHGEATVVLHVELDHALVALGGGDSRQRVLADLEGEGNVLR